MPHERTVSPDPQALAVGLYGASPEEPEEEGEAYREESTIPSESAEEKVLLFTTTGLADDSVRGIRYRLEFERADGQWRLRWVGQQVTCWPERGHEDWSTAPCL